MKNRFLFAVIFCLTLLSYQNGVAQACPDLSAIPTDVVCDDGDNQSELHLLFTYKKNSLPQGGSDGTLSYSFHPTEADATNNVNEISSGASNYYLLTSNSNIYIRGLNNSTNCVRVVAYSFRFQSKPTIGTLPDAQSCNASNFDLNAYRATNLTQIGITYTFHPSQNDADNKSETITNLSPYVLSPGDSDSLFVRAENSSGCYSISSFSLVVSPTPALANPLPVIEACNSGKSRGNFDLNAYRATNLTQTGVTYTFHLFQNDANNANNDITNLSAYNSTGTTLFVRAEDTRGCFNTSPLIIRVLPRPTLVSPLPSIQACDAGKNTANFDLNAYKTTNLTQNRVSYTFHPSRNDANNNSSAITNLSAHNSASTTLFVRAENVRGCLNVSPLSLEVLPRPTLANPLTNLQACNLGNSRGNFDLDAYKTTNLTQIGVTYTFHPSRNDANNNSSAITNLSAHNSASTTLFVRAINTASCVSISLFSLVVSRPNLVNPLPGLLTCDTGSRTGDFDLNAYRAANLTQIGVSYAFYTSQDDANNKSNAITSLSAYRSVSATLFVRAEDTRGCFNTSVLSIRVSPPPTLANPLPNIRACSTGNNTVNFDLNAYKTTNLTQVSVTYTFHVSQNDANNNSNAITNLFAYRSASATLFVRAMNTTACVSTSSFNIVVLPIPTLANPLPGIRARDAGNNTANFDLSIYKTTNLTQIGVSYTFHTSQSDADNNSNAVANLSAYNSGQTTLFVRAINAAACVSTSSFDLIVTLSLKPITLCDSDGDRNEYFDLLEYKKNNLTDGNVDYSFYTSSSDANSKSNPITNLSRYTSSIGVTKIYIRLETIDAPASYNISILDLILNPIPTFNETPLDYYVCDGSNFELKTRNANVYGSSPVPKNVGVIYYDSQNKARDRRLAINPSKYRHSNDRKQVFARIENLISGCFALTSFNTVYNPLPSVSDKKKEICDDDSDGIADFNLNEVVANITKELPRFNVSTSMHQTKVDAENNISPILLNTNFRNTSVNNQTIFFRIIDNNTNCTFEGPLNLVIFPLPIVNSSESKSVKQCGTNNSGDAVFNLSSYKELLTSDQTNRIYFYPTRTDANNNTNVLPDVYTRRNTYQSNVFFKAISKRGCKSLNTGMFSLFTINQLPLLLPSKELKYQACDDTAGTTTDGVASFDLNNISNKIGDVIPFPGKYIYTYHKTIERAFLRENDAPEISNFKNIDSPREELLTARVEDVSLNCVVVLENVADLKVITPPEKIVLTSDRDIFCANVNEASKKIILGKDFNLSSEFVYKWNTGENTPLITIADGGEYFVNIFHEALKKCGVKSNTIFIKKSEKPIINDFKQNHAIRSADNIIETIISNNPEYSKTFEFQIDELPYQDSNVFSDVPIGNHLVTVKDVKGCGLSSSKLLVLGFPRFFTPNGDGFNDYLYFGNVSKYLMEARIFDRDGILLKMISPQDLQWDGKFLGKPLPSDDYWVEIYYRDPNTDRIKTFVDSFSLKR